MRKILYILITITSCLEAFSQPQQYVFNRLSSKEGLASNVVYTIFQDKKGFIWFGTANGLQRYDGRKIMRFTPPPGSTDYLPASAISQMFEDNDGKIWVRSGKDVGVFDPATFRYTRATVQADVRVHPRAEYQLWQNSGGQIYLLITRLGLLAYDSVKNTFSQQNKPSIKPPLNWSVNTIVEDPITKNYWLGCDSGLALFDRKSLVTYSRHNSPPDHPVFTNPIANEQINVLFIDVDKRLWLTSWNLDQRKERYLCYDLNKASFTRDTAGLNGGEKNFREMHGFSQHSSGTLWAFGRMLLYTFDPVARRFNYIAKEHLDDYGIRYDHIFSMYEDKEQNLWIGTDQGVYAVNPGAQSFYTVKGYRKGDPVEISVTGFFQTEKKEIFVSTWGSGLLTYDAELWQTPNNVNSGAPASDNNFLMQWSICNQPGTSKVWIGCQSGRVIVHDHITGENHYYNLPIFEDKTVRQIITDRKGNLWFASQYGHIVKWDSRRGSLSRLKEEMVPVANLETIVYKLFEDRDGYIWAGTHEYGLFKIDPETGKVLQNYTESSGEGRSLFSSVVTDILPFNDSTLIIAAGAINFLNINSGKIKHISSAEGLPSNTVNSLQLDRQGSLWISLLSGLCRYNIKKNIFTSYAQRDGIFYDNFQIGASYTLADGSMVFGNTHDFISFDPNKLVSSETPPDVTITDFKLFNAYLPPDSILKLNEVKLGYKENSITIEFAALSFLQKDKIVYYYKLDGIDKEWLRTDRLLSANYTQLPPGQYTFEVWCENGDGVRSKNITTLRLHITPPFWNTWWFMLFVALLVAGIIYLAHRVKVNRLLDMEKVRRRIARDLHDDMGSTLSTINILSEMAKMKVESDTDRTKEYIGKISDNSSRMMEAMDDIVWSINPMNDNMQKVAARMREFATGVLEAKNIEYRFRVDEAVHDLKLDMEARRDFFLLFKEAVNNLAKYSQCTHADIDIHVMKSVLVMRIHDDGIGFDTKEADSGNGLMNMKKRAHSLKGKLKISSRINNGTTVTLEAAVN